MNEIPDDEGRRLSERFAERIVEQLRGACQCQGRLPMQTVCDLLTLPLKNRPCKLELSRRSMHEPLVAQNGSRDSRRGL